MPSPFPGMDPYLEGSEWTNVHTALAVAIAQQLTPRLQPKYIARTERRFVVTMPEADEDIGITETTLYPDAAVVLGANPPRRTGGGAVLDAPLQLDTLVAEKVPHVNVEIRDTEGRQLVTAIEILSPTNKRGDGRTEYLDKRQKLLMSTAHLMEIDLLRRGQRVPMRQPLPASPYFIFLSRANRRPRTGTWPVGLEQPLPTVPVPLLPGDADVPLDLQRAFTAVYDGYDYAQFIDYTKSPAVPLTSEQAAWATEHLGTAREKPDGGGASAV